ncbi:MAG TPA: tryptophan 7-halogenase [Sphingomonas sp.]|uniref:tryptophan 7-halogenase n=1 Tax=Sphingomonas sp. TaxID=28214 RepID=UPI002EDAE606
MTHRSPIRSIAILGAGIVGLSAAIAFARALPGLAITIVETPADPAAFADRMPGTLPSIAAFHDRIGLSEMDLLKAGAIHRIGTRLIDWTASGRPLILVDDDHGGAVAPGAFHQHWLNARRAGAVAPFDTFAPAAALAAADRFVHPLDDPGSPLSGFTYALRLDPPRYRDLLRAYAAHHRIRPVVGGYGGAERRADGGVAALLLADGRRIEADLYLDCAGPAAPLRTAIDHDVEDWSMWLPADRLLIGTERSPAPAPGPTDNVHALPSGWRMTLPLRDRTIHGLAYTAGQTSDARAARILPIGTELIAFRPGARRAPWRHNVVAIGDAAVTLDPLASANLHLAHAAILRAIDLLPGRDCAAVETAEYQRRTAWQVARVRDFQAAHYQPSGRTRGEFWRAAGRLPRPDTLAHTLDQFAMRGRLPFHEEESFGRDRWLALLLGLGIVPRLPDAIASATPVAATAAALRALTDAAAALPHRIPPYPAYLAQIEGRR